MASSLATGAKVSSKSIPSCWLYPCTTSLALFLRIARKSSSLFLKTHLVPITLRFGGLGTSCQTLFLSNCPNSSYIATIQSESVNATLILLGSIVEINEFKIQ
ncbi:hypothetical protein RND81_05G044200 [Saponaria officinalis]|uniref:Uncharacterized protein n=1 Tax=Saponaria officinalis TaxID=3572 RepID=A0AAW1KVE0_SAPOF